MTNGQAHCPSKGTTVAHKKLLNNARSPDLQVDRLWHKDCVGKVKTPIRSVNVADQGCAL
jgi:hypothetical protein